VARFRFAHLSNAHLGAPRFGDPSLVGDGKLALQEALRRCQEENVDFILLAGSLFHRTQVPPEVLSDVEEILQELQGLPLLVAEKHTGSSYLHYLDQRGLLRCLTPPPEGSSYPSAWKPGGAGGHFDEPLPGVRIHALSPAPLQLAQQLHHLPPGEETTLGLFPGSRRDLQNPAFQALEVHLDYVACGDSGPPSQDGWSYSPGPLQPLFLEEVHPDPPGFFLVSHEEGKVGLERLEVRGRPVVQLPDLLLHKVHSAADLQDCLQKHLQGQAEIPSDSIVTQRLCGQVPFSFLDFDPSALCETLRDHFGVQHVVLSNQLNIDSESNETGPLNRHNLEREVLQEVLLQELPEYQGRSQELLDLMASIQRKNSLSEEGLREILELTRSFLGDQP
jgi:hypothetical protein